ncbi:MAG: T9SS type A sorting domain-containing protein [Bacteroidota bacterium]
MKKLLIPILIVCAFVQVKGQNRKVLLEEFTGAYCGQCPMGSYYVDSMLDKHPDLIAVSLHAYSVPDAMDFAQIDTLYNNYSAGAPLACVDRIYWGSWPYVAITQSGWDARIQTRLAVAAQLNVSINPLSWNATSRGISGTVNVNILSNLPTGDYRIGIYVVEDSVSGTGPGYDQANVYDGSPGSPFYGMGDPIVGYIHRHVARALLPTAWGATGILPPAPLSGQSFTYPFAYTLPFAYNENRVSLIAFVYRFTAGHQGDEVLNADQQDLLSPTGHEDLLSVKNFNAYPNPTSGIITILSQEELSCVDVMDIAGNRIISLSGKSYNQEIDVSNLARGIYLIRVTVKDGSCAVKKIIVN